jgi:protein-tyrosine phosphatase
LRKQLVTGKKLLLFIDTGDNCRCPLASGYLHKLLDARNIKYIDIKTAGVMTPTGLLPTPEVVQLLQEEGVDIRRHRSRPLTNELIRQADLILGMTPIHVQKAIRMTDDARGKTFLLKEYVGNSGRNVQIPDPMGGTLEIFKKCFSDIRQSLQKLVEMEFIAQPPEAREMVVVDTTPVAARPQPHGAPKEGAPKPKAAKPATGINKPQVLPSAKPARKPATAPARPVAKKAAAPAKPAKPAAKPAAKAAAKPAAKSTKPAPKVKAAAKHK